MSDIEKNIGEFLKNEAKGVAQELFAEFMKNVTKFAQKRYGFGGDTAHNDEADAFRHAYMQWIMAWYCGLDFAKEKGDGHENWDGNPEEERNMDLWNNSIGRETAYEMKKELGENYDLFGDEWSWSDATKRICEKMEQGELITDPFTDRRKFENMEYERLRDEDKIYSDEEYDSLDEKTKAMAAKRFMEQVIENNWEIPHVETLNRRVRAGELIYVESYVRADGTRVHGYYRRHPVR